MTRRSAVAFVLKSAHKETLPWPNHSACDKGAGSAQQVNHGAASEIFEAEVSEPALYATRAGVYVGPTPILNQRVDPTYNILIGIVHMRH